MSETPEVTEDENDDEVLVSRRRLERLGEVLASLSIGEFSEEHLAIAPVEDEFGVTEQMFGQFAQDHAEAVRELERSVHERNRLIDRLREAMKAMSTPIIDVAEGVLTLPIVGVVDAERAAEMTERLLRRISKASARCVIIDVTGVDDVDDATASHLLRMVQAAELLGSYVLIVGISPSVAMRLIAWAELTRRDQGFRTYRSLRDGLRECRRYLREREGRGVGR